MRRSECLIVLRHCAVTRCAVQPMGGDQQDPRRLAVRWGWTDRSCCRPSGKGRLPGGVVSVLAGSWLSGQIPCMFWKVQQLTGRCISFSIPFPSLVITARSLVITARSLVITVCPGYHSTFPGCHCTFPGCHCTFSGCHSHTDFICDHSRQLFVTIPGICYDCDHS